ARYESTGAPPSRSNRDRFGSSQELDTVVEQEARAEAKAKQAAHEAEDPEEVTLEAVYDTAPIHQRRSWPWPPAAAPRSMAGERRKRARDGFNVQELLFGDALAQRDFSDPSVEDVDQLSPGSSLSGWGRGDFRAQLRDLQSLLRAVEGREWEDSEVLWVLRLALRKQEGAALLRPSCLRYALLARHGFQSLSFPELQLLAMLQFQVRREKIGEDGATVEDKSEEGIVQGVNLLELKRLMQHLNEGKPVADREVYSVVQEAVLLSGAETISRKDLMRGLGAWYANVQRSDSPPSVFLHAWSSALLYGKEYHTTLMEKLRQLLPSVLRVLRRQRKDPEESSARLLSSPTQRWLERCWGLGAVAALLLGLGLPGTLFAWAIYMGAEHGDDACPRDLDGLLTWRRAQLRETEGHRSAASKSAAPNTARGRL
ncbi:unnamed protein product, partial [Effrenium voratum]